MSKRSVPASLPPSPQVSDASRRRWLLLAYQLPATPSNLRVKTWRRLQDLGAIAVKQAVYVLPDSAESREDFEWLRVEIEGSGGEATVFAATQLSSEAEAALVDEFRHSRQTLYTELAAELQRQQPRDTSRRAPLNPRDIARWRQRFQAIERIDFFGSAGRDRVASLMAGLEARRGGVPRQEEAPDAGDRPRFQGRLWVTRPRPGVDRMSSAWLIRRCIDPAATFAFVTDVKNAPADSMPFDMYGGGFGHEGDRCTFETLVARFGIVDPAVARLSEVVHDLDLKDGKFSATEAVTLGAAIDGLQMSCPDDHQLLDQGMILFEAMYRSFSQHRPPGPRPVARVKGGPRSTARKTRSR